MGRKPVLEALEDGKNIEKIWVDRTVRGDFEKEIRKLAKIAKIPLSSVPIEKLNKIHSGNHQGIIAQISPIEYQSLETIIPFFYEQGISPKILILDGVEDVRNFAAISRSALWFGFDTIVTSLKSAAQVNAIAMKASAGALNKIPICREKSALSALLFLKESGFTIYGADGEASDDIYKTEIVAPLVLVMGSEQNGMSKEVKSACDKIVAIPGTQKIESLNVSVAAAIIMGHIYNQSG